MIYLGVTLVVVAAWELYYQYGWETLKTFIVEYWMEKEGK